MREKNTVMDKIYLFIYRPQMNVCTSLGVKIFYRIMNHVYKDKSPSACKFWPCAMTSICANSKRTFKKLFPLVIDDSPLPFWFSDPP